MTTRRPSLRSWYFQLRFLSRVAALVLGMSLLAGVLRGQANYTPYAFATVAGKASVGSADGPGDAARFAFPDDVAVDRAGNLYVADTANHTIRKITPDGMVTTLAGLAGVSGTTDGAGSAARFYWPEGIAVDFYGNVYVADTYNQTIRKITPGGMVTTLAGIAGSNGNLDGIGTAAAFNYPAGVAVDGAGNVYVAETINHDVRKISPAGVVTTLAGMAGSGGNADGVGSTARFSFPCGVAVDAWGNIYVADTDNDRIREITPAGTVTTLRLADGAAAVFHRPQKLGLDAAGNVYVSDSTNHRIVRLTAAGDLATMAVLPADLPLDPAAVPYAVGVAVDALGNVYVADTGNSAIRRVTPAGVVTTVAGFGPAFGSADGAGSAARFYGPAGIATDASANLYLADSANHTIRKITPTGVVTTVAGLAGAAGAVDGVGSAARFNSPAAVTVDFAGNVFVADAGNFTIRKISPAGVVTTVAGLAGAAGSVDGTGSAARFYRPQSLAVDALYNIYVADLGLARSPYATRAIRKIASDGSVTTLTWLPLTIGVPPLPPMALSIAIDRAGNLYAADYYSAVVWIITSDGTASVLAGVAAYENTTSIDGPADVARFTAPTGLALDAAGNVYVTDVHAVRRIARDGVVTTLAGVSGAFGSADGAGSSARFNAPSGLAMDNAGRLYVADTDNHTVRAGVAASAPVILTEPQSQAASAGTNIQLAVTVAGSPEPTLQWFRNSSAISGATGSTLTLVGVMSSDAGDYTVTATNAMGSATSNKATLTVSAASAGTPAAGGGAIDGWFLVVLVVLTVARKRSLGIGEPGCGPTW